MYMKNIFNNAVTVFILLAILLILFPLPTWLLDMMLIVNISLSLIVLLTTMYIKESLEFSIFPSMLLITTLFRLSLNISSTRLILGNGGNAGHVIKSFGEFVIGGNAIVGFIIFILIVIVQFIVITKGAERVAEVSARFTLDAMPGKQMAIDADLNSGLIDEATAKLRRKKIEQEADFFGAMDGASKFVKGDAIFSIIAAFVNLIGGAIIGMMNGGNFMDVMSTYSIATVGDGLVSQIPALLISTAMGMIVTRSASEGSLNSDIKNQFASQPMVLIITGAVISLMFLVPGFHMPQMLVIGALLIGLGIMLMRSQKVALAQAGAKELSDAQAELSEMEYYKDIDNVYKLLAVEPIEMEFGYSLIPLVDEASGGKFIERVVIFRKQFALEMGMVFPSVRMRDNQHINPNQYVIKIKGETVAEGEILADHYLALDSGGVTQEIEGIDTIEPAFHIPAKWISEDKKVMADIAGYTLIDPTSVMITHLSEVIKAHAHELLTRQDIKTMLDKLKQSNPSLVEDIVPNVVSVAYLQKILGNLLKEGVPIRDLETILETLSDYASTLKDTDVTTEYVRQALKRTITRKFSDAGQIRVFTLDTDLENKIVSSMKKSDQGSYLAMDPETIHKIVTAFQSQYEKVKEVIPSPIVLSSPIVRIYFKRLIDQFIPNVIVLSFNEIDNTVQIQSLGNISLE
ncbi:MAG: flagellar biosynthesis protein FlhA [Clostridiales bacterium]|jgi:flagellar biosynthesis protein FlhA|nr:flagellar biosynthesis protein FlhA [Oscillospiraceae bacterium]MDN5377838.1 flagellar biosynthesis protein FlhA [Clostridiales bacterium]